MMGYYGARLTQLGLETVLHMWGLGFERRGCLPETDAAELHNGKCYYMGSKSGYLHLCCFSSDFSIFHVFFKRPSFLGVQNQHHLRNSVVELW